MKKQITVNHFSLSKMLGVDHGRAVIRAREFCPSGKGTGAHGSTCPCNECTTEAVLELALEDLRSNKK